MKKTLPVILLLLLILAHFGSRNEALSQTREITDIAGRTVSIPVKPRKIACVQGNTYEVVFAMGGKNRVGAVKTGQNYPLALITNPAFENYPSMGNVGPKSPVNIEEYTRLGIDLVFYYNIPQELEKFANVGIPAVVVNYWATKPQCLKDAIQDQKKKIGLVADILGGEGLKRYEKWVGYLDEKVAFIKSRISEVPKFDYPIVYSGNAYGENILVTWGAFSTHRFIADLCGGSMVGVSGPGQFPKISKEQLLTWAPEVIIVDNHGGNPERVIERLQTSADWSVLPAVKNGRIYRIPTGVFFLDRATTAPIYYLWLAKQLHPGCFQDLDIAKEMQHYYSVFYDHHLSDEDANHALRGWGN